MDGGGGGPSDVIANHYCRSFDFIIKSGRTLAYPVYYGTREREKDAIDDTFPNQRLTFIIKDFSRVIDYLETRTDFDSSRIAAMGVSFGGIFSSFLPPIEKRVRVSILSGFVGCPNIEDGKTKTIDVMDQINFVVRTNIPVLMLNGRYDIFYPNEVTVKPMFDLLATNPRDKKLVIYDTDHYIPYREMVKETLAWLDKYLGKVNK